jgi:hypothetical protein
MVTACTAPTANDEFDTEPTLSTGITPTTTLLSTLSPPASPTPFVRKDDCHIVTPPFIPAVESDGPRPSAAGFPRWSGGAPLLNPKILLLPFGFEDAPISEATLGAAQGGLNTARRYFEFVSWGKASFSFELAPEALWIRVPEKSSSLGFAKDSPKNRNSWYWFRDVLQFASEDLNLDGYDIIYLVGPPNVIEWFTAVMELTEPPIESPAGTVRRALLVTRDYSNFVIAHEMGHAWLSLEDLYLLVPETTDFVGLNRFDLMGLTSLNEFSSLDMTVWNKVLAGWVSDDMFLCVNSPGTYRAFISANSDKNSLPKAVGVRLSESRILIVETWRKSTYNMCCDETIAYVVDAGRAAGSGPYRLQGALKDTATQMEFDQGNFVTTSKMNLTPNERVLFESITVRLIDSDRSGALIELIVS